jgi:hypothetical protein
LVVDDLPVGTLPIKQWLAVSRKQLAKTRYHNATMQTPCAIDGAITRYDPAIAG